MPHPPFLLRRLSRRELCAGAALLAGGAVAGRLAIGLRGGESAAPAIVQGEVAPLAFLSTASAPQGSAFSLHVRADAGTSGAATFNGQKLALLPLDGYLVGLFAAGQPAGDEDELAPGDYNVHVDLTSSSAASANFDLPITVSTTQFTEDAVTIPDDLLWLLGPDVQQQEAQQLAHMYSAVTPQPLWSGLFAQPVQGEITTLFGEARSYNGGPISGHHSGMDIAVPQGTPISVCAAGRVAFAGPLQVRGNFTAIDHGLGVYSGYAHQAEIDVQVGQLVQQGDIIGKAGTTGLSTGPHLHWECAVQGMNVDALHWTTVLLP
jgi:murein DD-endopeptidase MepM/ murein hydrolase activator NlpD